VEEIMIIHHSFIAVARKAG